MTSIYQQLYDTYGEHVLREHELYDDDAILEALDQLPMDRKTKVQICDLAYESYDRWSAAAFCLGLHLGLSLASEASRQPEPEAPPR